jgi:hypothetical protein
VGESAGLGRVVRRANNWRCDNSSVSRPARCLGSLKHHQDDRHLANYGGDGDCSNDQPVAWRIGQRGLEIAMGLFLFSLVTAFKEKSFTEATHLLISS